MKRAVIFRAPGESEEDTKLVIAHCVTMAYVPVLVTGDPAAAMNGVLDGGADVIVCAAKLPGVDVVSRPERRRAPRRTRAAGTVVPPAGVPTRRPLGGAA